jgi:hypothetical protein
MVCQQTSATTGAEARVDFEPLRGAEAPIFHVAANIRNVIAGFATDQIR